MPRELLNHSQAHGPKVASVIAHTMTSNAEHLDPVGDLYLLARLRGLADSHLPHPALELTGDLSCIRGCEVRVTVTGEDVLSGRRNFVELNGVDDWVGGVHLDSGTGPCGPAAARNSWARPPPNHVLPTAAKARRWGRSSAQARRGTARMHDAPSRAIGRFRMSFRI